MNTELYDVIIKMNIYGFKNNVLKKLLYTIVSII